MARHQIAHRSGRLGERVGAVDDRRDAPVLHQRSELEQAGASHLPDELLDVPPPKNQPRHIACDDQRDVLAAVENDHSPRRERTTQLAQGPAALDPNTILNSQPKGPNGRPILPNGVTAFIIPKRMRLPTTDAWNVTLQHQLLADIAVEAAYIGTKGTHVFAGFGGDYDFNQARIEGFGTLTTNQRKPFFQKFGWSQNFRYYGSDASNNYHAMQLKAEKRFSKGYSLLGHYTWSRAFHYTGTYYNIDAKLAYGPNDNHRSHLFTLNGVWELPFGKGRKYAGGAARSLDLLVGGWQVNNIWSFTSGTPFDVTASGTSLNAPDQAAFLFAYLLAWGVLASLVPRYRRALASGAAVIVVGVLSQVAGSGKPSTPVAGVSAATIAFSSATIASASGGGEAGYSESRT